MEWVFLNGELIPAEKAALPVADRGLLFGYGLFETMRARAGRVFRLEEHYRRLLDGANVLAIVPPLTLDGLRAAIEELTRRNAVEDARVRLTVTAGSTPERGEATPSVLITAMPVRDYPPEQYERGMSAIVSSIQRNERSPLSRIKSLNRLDSVLAREEARNRNADEALLLNTCDLLAEGSMSNLFLVVNGRLLTPPVATGALPGITRSAVIELARPAGVDCREADLSIDMLATTEEAFLTGAIMGVMPLTQIDGHAVGSGKPGRVTELLRHRYEITVQEER